MFSSARIPGTDVTDINGRVYLVILDNGSARPDFNSRTSSILPDQISDLAPRHQVIGVAKIGPGRVPRRQRPDRRERPLAGTTGAGRDHPVGHHHCGFPTDRFRHLFGDHRCRVVVDRQ